MPDNRAVDASGLPLEDQYAENGIGEGHSGNGYSENGYSEIGELHRRVSELEDENSRLRDQMLQANLYELAQRRENDVLRAQLES